MLRKTNLDMVKCRARVLLNCKPKFSKDSHFVIHPFFGIDCFVEDGKNVLSIRDVFNFSFKFEEIRKDVEDILKIKYNLRITNDTPLTMEIISKGNEKEW